MTEPGQQSKEHGPTCPSCGSPLSSRARIGGRCKMCGAVLIYSGPGGLERRVYAWSYYTQTWLRLRFDYETKWFVNERVKPTGDRLMLDAVSEEE